MANVRPPATPGRDAELRREAALPSTTPATPTRAPWWRPTRRRLLLSLIVLVPAGLAAAWFGGGRWMFQPKRWGEIEPGLLYRSGQIHPWVLEDTLREHGIKIIVDLAKDETGRTEHDTENDVAARLGIRKVDLFELDGSGRGNPENYVTALREMVAARKAGVPLLVHCAAGTQRTGGATALYRMFIQGRDGAQAYAEYMDYRGRPDSGKLMAFLNEHMARIAARLAEEGVIDSVPQPLPHFGPAGSAPTSR